MASTNPGGGATSPPLPSHQAADQASAASRPTTDLDGTDPHDTPTPDMRQPVTLGLNLFWRSFFLLLLLLGSVIFTWLYTIQRPDLQWHSVQAAQHVATLVTLTRTTLEQADPAQHFQIRQRLAEQEHIRILRREPDDRFTPLAQTRTGQRLTQELTQRLGPDTAIAGCVNGESGLWIGTQVLNKPNWVLMERSRITPPHNPHWLLWLGTVLLLSLAGAIWVARTINRPFMQLLRLVQQVRDSDFAIPLLPAQASTSEVREIQQGLNGMLEKLHQAEQERAIMLAGISHDLRTPLARLRLEAEMSVADDSAREHMVADITQLDATIDKFLDYARPDFVQLEPVHLYSVAAACVHAMQIHHDLQVQLAIPHDLYVLADEVELSRIQSNLLENARRYGKTEGQNWASVQVSAKAQNGYIHLKVRDHGSGVASVELKQLIQPFFRSDSARTAATGAGLGLAIVDKAVRRMGGKLTLCNADSGGLVAHIQLKQASSPPKEAQNS